MWAYQAASTFRMRATELKESMACPHWANAHGANGATPHCPSRRKAARASRRRRRPAQSPTQRGHGETGPLGRARRPAVRNKASTARGFEPLRAEPNGFRVHLLNHSDTLSCRMLRRQGLARRRPVAAGQKPASPRRCRAAPSSRRRLRVEASARIPAAGPEVRGASCRPRPLLGAARSSANADSGLRKTTRRARRVGARASLPAAPTGQRLDDGA